MRARAGRVATHRGGLAGFEQPRFLQVEPLNPAEAPPPAAADQIRGQALVGRAALAVVLILSSPLLDRSSHDVELLGWLIALVWVPGVGVLDLAERRWHVRHLGMLDLLWDLALFATADAILHVPATAALGYLVVTAFHAYIGGPRRAIAALVVCATAAVAVPLATDQQLDRPRLAVELLGLGLLAWLLADASHRHDTSRAGLVQVSERAAAIVAGIADAVVVMSPRGRIQEWNPAASRTFGYPAQAGPGARCAERLGLHSGLRALTCDQGCALLAEAVDGSSVEVWRYDAAQRRQPLLASAAPVLDEHGTTVEVIHSFRDITALKAADEAKTLFLATASHELKTPLTVIHGFAQMLQLDHIPDGQRSHALGAIEVRSKQLMGIVDRLLMSSRIEGGRIDLDLVLVDLAPLLRERAMSLQGATSRRIEVVGQDDVPPAHADADAVMTVLDHLVDNAVKYSPGGGPVRLELTDDAARGVVLLSVTDDGIGMTPDQIEQCFERFWQGELSDVRRFGGTGIGLYIVRSLVDAMGGEIEVHSTPGHGSTFTVTLPTAAPEPAADDEEAPTEPAARQGESSMIREYMRQVGVPLQRTGGRQ